MRAESVLVIAATARELAPDARWTSLVCGVGPVDAAAATAAALARHRPAAILHVGIAGAWRSSRLAAGTIVIGRESRYCDISVPAEMAPRLVQPSATLVEAARGALPAALVLPIGTSACVGGTVAAASGCDVEAMEGFAVLRAAALAGVPALEVRAISNDIEEADRARWQFDAAFAAILRATPLLVEAVTRTIDAAHA